jgi:hypothetical protein
MPGTRRVGKFDVRKSTRDQVSFSIAQIKMLGDDDICDRDFL